MLSIIQRLKMGPTGNHCYLKNIITFNLYILLSQTWKGYTNISSMWLFLFHIYFRFILAIKIICCILSSFAFILEMSIAYSKFNLINRKLGEQQINCISWQAWKWLFFILFIIECVICTLQKYYLNYIHWATIQPNISIKHNIFRMVLSNWLHKVENC